MGVTSARLAYQSPLPNTTIVCAAVRAGPRLYRHATRLYGRAVRRSHVRYGVGALVIAAFAGVGYLLHSSFETQKKTRVDRSSLDGMLPDAVQWIQNFHRIEIRDGKKAWELEADEAQFLQDQNQVLVRKPRTTLYMKDGEKVTVTGDQGTVAFQGKDLQAATLHDSVVIHVRGFVIRANDAVYDRATDQIVAKGPVQIEGEQVQVAGNDMTVFVKESRFQLEKTVHVTLAPKALDAPRRS
jgi:LPS export ABC transporter protein LptC